MKYPTSSLYRGRFARLLSANLIGLALAALWVLPPQLSAFQIPALFNNLEEELVIREHGSWSFGQVGDIHADTSGNLYISDDQYQHIKVFSAEGELLRVIGRQGRGHGAFQDMVSVDLWDSQLLVLDRTGRRVSWLDAGTGELLDEFTFPPQDVGGSNGIPHQVLALGDSLAGVVFTTRVRPENLDGHRPELVVSFNRQGKVLAAPLLTGSGPEVLAMEPSPGSFRVIPRPFGRSPIFRRGPDGSLYYCWTGKVFIRRFNPHTGEPEGYVDQTFKPSPVLPGQVDSVRNTYPDPNFLEAFEAEMHSEWPALEQFVVDERDRIWVQFRAGDRHYRNLWAFNRSDSIEIIIDHDVRGRVALVRNSKVYTLEEDGSGRPVIRRFGIVKALN